MFILEETTRLKKLFSDEYLIDFVDEKILESLVETTSNLTMMRSRVLLPKSLLKRRTITVQKVFTPDFEIKVFLKSVADCLLYSQNMKLKVNQSQIKNVNCFSSE